MISPSETIKDFISQLKNCTTQILNNSPRTKDQYSSLDPMLKFNFDETLGMITSSFIISVFKNLNIYSILSRSHHIQFVGPENFLKKATNQNEKLVEILRTNVDESFLVEEILDNLKPLGQHSYQEDILRIQNEFNELHRSIKKNSDLEREVKKNEMLRNFLRSRLDCERIMNLVFTQEKELLRYKEKEEETLKILQEKELNEAKLNEANEKLKENELQIATLNEANENQNNAYANIKLVNIELLKKNDSLINHISRN